MIAVFARQRWQVRTLRVMESAFDERVRQEQEGSPWDPDALVGALAIDLGDPDAITGILSAIAALVAVAETKID